MNAPACRICGKKHWATDPHQFETAASNGVTPKKSNGVTSPVTPLHDQKAPQSNTVTDDVTALRRQVAELTLRLAEAKAEIARLKTDPTRAERQRRYRERRSVK